MKNHNTVNGTVHGGVRILRRRAVFGLRCAVLLLCGCTSAPAPSANEGGDDMPREPVVFFGDSITYLGRWEQYFPDTDVINLGVSGDRIIDLQERIGSVHLAQPGTLFIMVGVNDILSGYTVDETIAEYKRLLQMCPPCKIYVQSVLPADAGFGEATDRIPQFNERLKALCDEWGVEYVDLFPLYDDGTGHLAREYTGDGLHLLSSAYTKWVNRIRGLVEGTKE